MRIAVLAVVLVTLLGWPLSGRAEGRTISLIRDTEVETILRTYTKPIFLAAHLDPDAIHIYLVNDNQINAFVAGGQNLFINTGLLMQSKDAGQVIGVIAHETGHIEGGHLSRVQDALRRNTAENILGIILGAAVSVAGRPDVGSALALGGQNVATRNLLQYSRTQEGSADAAAMRYLDATQQSAEGLLSFFQLLAKQDMLLPTQQDPFLRSHPLTQDRITALQAFVQRSPYSNKPIDPKLEAMHRRMVAKLAGFLEDPIEVERRYPASDTSLEARYARAVADHRLNRPKEALAGIDSLIAEHPNDPYFQEVKGQILLETGHPWEALSPYRRAVDALPDAPLLRSDLARIELGLNDPVLLKDAITNFRLSLLREPDRPSVWRQLAVALGRNGQEGESALALAEEALLLGKDADAKYHAGKAERILPTGSPDWLRAQDIQQVITQNKG